MASKSEKKSGGESWGETIKTVVYALLIALVVRTFLFEPFSIPSGSMKPTLLVGDYLFVSKYSYGYSKYSFPLSPGLYDGRVMGDIAEVKRGDVAVFRKPTDTSEDYIKRVIGLPGDEIQMIDGILHINGKPIPREKVGVVTIGSNRLTEYKETLPEGVEHSIWEASDRMPQDNTPVYRVPKGKFFMMGDNRDNSTDSRFSSVGYVPFENFIGRADILFFSHNGSGSLWKPWTWPGAIRYGRLFNSIH